VTAAEAGREVYDLRFEPSEQSHLAAEHKSEAFVASVTDLLAHADNLIQVRTVEIRQVPLGDVALAHLGALEELEALHIEQSVITDAGLAHLSRLRRLVRLELQDTKLSDAGLGQLARLTGLRSLTLGSTLVTDEGREKLGHSLPECEMTLAPHEIAIRKVRGSLESFGVTADHRDGSGFYVTDVAEDSPAAFGQVHSGAVITRINGEPVLRRSEVIPVSEKLRELQCSLVLDGQDEPLVLASTLAGFEVFPRHPDYDHDRFGTRPSDILLEFRAFVSSFDGPDDDNGDGSPDIRATPEWVASEIKRDSGEVEDLGRLRRSFETDDLLHRMKLAPSARSYGRQGFDRGHLFSPRHARKLGEHAVAGTGYVVNLAPQTPSLNRFTWNTLEKLTLEWLESYGSLWVVAGPVYYRGASIAYLETEDGVPIAVPHAFFKILIREDGDGLHVLPFLFPQQSRQIRNPESLVPYVTSVDVIEALTGLDFFTRLSGREVRKLEREVPAELWPMVRTH
jgi:DNA/RNA endonuclease G (NUC1)